MARRLLLLLVVLPLLRPIPSGAHAVGVSRGDYRIEGDRLHVDLVFARRELATAVPAIDRDGDGELSADEVPAAGDALAAWLRTGLEVRADAGRCTGGLETARAVEEDGAALAAVYRCPRAGRSIAYGSASSPT